MSLTIKKLALLLLVLSFLFAGCTRYANEDELKVLKDTQDAAKKAQTKLATVKQDRRNLENKLADKEKELAAAKEEKAAVESRIK
ncbi:MAG: hypothetical protein JXR69_03530 [Candidatus Delongbacteria bacterium]|nr:hypothetical protein [Candidatus Delongbacteria bacterium]